MASPDPIRPYRQVQAKSDAELTRILELTARSIRARIARMPVGIGGDVRGAQLRATLGAIGKMQRSMWSSVDGVARSGVDDATKAAESGIETMTRVAYASLPDGAAEALVRGLRASAESGLKSDAARKRRELSSRVYVQAALHEGKVEDVIRQGLIANLSAKELAASAYEYVSPTAKGGASYAAMRLARTEINNAFHERQLEGAKRPGVRAAKWNLSGSHKVPDECNVYAAHNGTGEWPVDLIPEKPHPQCFCYLTYVTTPPEEFRKRLVAGSFDDEIDRRTRENMALAGQSVGTVKAKADTEVKPSTEVESFIRVQMRSKFITPAEVPGNVARRFNISEDEAQSYINWVKANGDVPTIREAKPAPTKARPSKVVQKTTPPVPVEEDKVTSSNVVPIKAEGEDPLNRVSGEGRDRVQRVLDEQRGFVPNVMRKFNGVRKMSTTEAKIFEGKYGKDALGGYTVETREVAIHPQVFTKKYDREFARDLKSGFFSKCGHDHGSVESFVAHETGHHVDNIMRTASPAEIKAVWRALAESMGLKPPLLTDKTSLNRWVERNQPTLAKKVSGYGSEDAGELIAEIWAEYTTNKDARPHVKAAGDEIRKVAEKAAGGVTG